MKKIGSLLTLALLLLGGCDAFTSNEKSVNKNLLEYSPSEVGTVREYTTYSDNSDSVMINSKTLMHMEELSKLEDGTVVYNHQYEESLVFSDDPSNPVEYNSVVEISESAIYEIKEFGKSALLKNSTTWTRDEETEVELLDSDASVTTSLDTFENCMELAYTVPFEQEVMEMKEFICPVVGRVITKYRTDTSSEYDIFSELTFFNSPSVTLGESYESVIANAENPLISMNSGILPSRTDKISNLNFNEYRDRVNESSLESIGYYLINNPDSYIEENSTVQWEFVDGISILVDSKNYNIIEVSMKHFDGVSEESFIYSRDLIRGLDDSITEEQISKILYPTEPGEKVELDNFIIGMRLTEDQFELLIVAK